MCSGAVLQCWKAPVDAHGWSAGCVVQGVPFHENSLSAFPSFFLSLPLSFRWYCRKINKKGDVGLTIPTLLRLVYEEKDHHSWLWKHVMPQNLPFMSIASHVVFQLIFDSQSFAEYEMAGYDFPAKHSRATFSKKVVLVCGRTWYTYSTTAYDILMFITISRGNCMGMIPKIIRWWLNHIFAHVWTPQWCRCCFAEYFQSGSVFEKCHPWDLPWSFAQICCAAAWVAIPLSAELYLFRCHLPAKSYSCAAIMLPSDYLTVSWKCLLQI